MSSTFPNLDKEKQSTRRSDGAVVVHAKVDNLREKAGEDRTEFEDAGHQSADAIEMRKQFHNVVKMEVKGTQTIAEGDRGGFTRSNMFWIVLVCLWAYFDLPGVSVAVNLLLILPNIKPTLEFLLTADLTSSFYVLYWMCFTIWFSMYQPIAILLHTITTIVRTVHSLLLLIGVGSVLEFIVEWIE